MVVEMVKTEHVAARSNIHSYADNFETRASLR